MIPTRIKLNVICILSTLLPISESVEKVTYISVEHPNVTYIHERFWHFFKLTSRRYNRANPIYYVGIHTITKHTLDNNVKLDFYFFELLTNQYKRSFVEMHFRWCNFIEKDMFFGAAVRQGPFAKPCPHRPGEYKLENMTILPESIPPGFPFTKGRIVANFTYLPENLMIASGYIDMEVRTLKVKNRIKYKKL